MDVVHDVPARLGRYEIVERLAAGGMGEVFVARAFGSGGFIKPVALKRIHPHLAQNDAFIHMLHDEANVASAIQHPNIVATIDVGCDDGNHFVVLDYVSGDPLSRIVRELRRRDSAMPISIVVWIGAQVASALHAAHEAKNLAGQRLDIVHRDVSLANVMLSDAGHPMLFDFGVAKAAQRIHQTSHGELKGKLAYMAPETFHGAPVDRTVDVFSLGVVLYELLTAKSPFQRETDLETISALQRAVVPPPSHFRPEVDAALDAIAMRAMARERAVRFPTAAHVEQALREWARAHAMPHDAGHVAAWLEVTFPERLAARRELLARVADPRRDRVVARGAPVASHEGGTPVSGPLCPSGLKTTPAPNRISVTSSPATPVGVRGGTQVMPAPATASTVAGVARHASIPTAASPAAAASRRSWMPLAGAILGACAGVVGVVLFVGRGTPTTAPVVGAAAEGPNVAAPTGTDTAPPPSARAEAPPPSTASAEAPPAASEAPPATAKSVAAQPPRKPKDVKPAPKGKGPLVRTYDP